jgi:cellulose synthase (UDP-forming)
VVNAEIPYIPTAKNAVVGYITPFIRPMIIHAVVFTIAVAGVFIYRKYYMPESELALSAERTWGMVGFAFLAFIMAIGGIFAALEAWTMKNENPWDKVNLKS